MTSGVVRRWGRAGAGYDLVVTVLFAAPWTARVVFEAMRGVHEGLGLAGAPPPVPGATTLLMVSLFGVAVCMWSIARWLRPEPVLIGMDAVGRLVFSAWFLWALAQGESRVLVGFLVLELVWALVQGVAVVSQYGRGRAHR
jgi:hypothetical protein